MDDARIFLETRRAQ